MGECSLCGRGTFLPNGPVHNCAGVIVAVTRHILALRVLLHMWPSERLAKNVMACNGTCISCGLKCLLE